jgi:hypothetical protein
VIDVTVLEIVLLAVAGEFGLGVAIGTFLRGPRRQPVPVLTSRRAGLLNVEKAPALIEH